MKGITLEPGSPLGNKWYSNVQFTAGLNSWKFPATTKVLGITAFNSHCGCNCGVVYFSCTAAVKTPWNGVSSGDHMVQILGSEEKDKIERLNTDWATDSDKATAMKADEW